MKSSETFRPHSHQRGLAALLASLSGVGPFSIDAYLPSMPEIQRVMHTSTYALQLTLTAYMVPFALMMLWHGAISDAFGRRRVILWGMGLFTLASVGCVFAQNISMLLCFRVLQGATAGAGMVVGRAIVRDRFDGADAQRVMAQVSMTFALAPAIAPVIGGFLQEYFGWRAVFAFLVLYSGTVFFLCRRVLPETLPVSRRQSLHPIRLAESYWGVLTSLPFLAISLCSTCFFGGIFVYIASAPVFLMKYLAVSSTGFFWLFGPLTAGMALGAATSGKFAGKISPERTMAYAFALVAFAAAGNFLFHALHAPLLPWSILPLFFYALGMAIAFPTLTLLALDLFPVRRGLAASCQSFIQTGGAAIVAAFAWLVWQSMYSLAATQVCAIVAAGVFFAIYRLQPHRVAAPSEPVAALETALH